MTQIHVVLFEDNARDKFLPLVFTRPVGELRLGIVTIREKWQIALNASVGHRTQPYLSALFSEGGAADIAINARLLPTRSTCERIAQLEPGEAWIEEGVLLAERYTSAQFQIHEALLGDHVFLLNEITDLFALNHKAIALDFAVATHRKASAQLHQSNVVIGDASQVFLEDGAKVWASILNTTEGPIYLAKDAEILEGSMVRGPFVLGEHSQLKMGTKVYTGSTIGPHCKVGGELSNSILQGYSNKGHDGFLGNSLLGEWCNLGADTNSSNLKNNYAPVKIWSYAENKQVQTALTFCGLIMGDHSKSGINTMFNTATVVGVSANIYGGGFPPKHVPSFAWGGADGFDEYELHKALDTARRVMARRGRELSAVETAMLTEVFRMSQSHRDAATQSQQD